MEKMLPCSNCKTGLKFAGTKRFLEGKNWGVFGDLGELFVNKETFDVYHCPKCGKATRIVKRMKDRERSVPGGIYISCSACEFFEKL